MGTELMETMCNPITQAEVLNKEGVDLAILLGLCVGHDSLFSNTATHRARFWRLRTGFLATIRLPQSIFQTAPTMAG